MASALTFMRVRYATNSYEASKTRRLKRIRSRATVELSRAFEAGKLSLRQYDLRSRLEARQQKRLITVERARIASALVAAHAIDEFLNDIKAGQVRLSDVELAIRKALALAQWNYPSGCLGAGRCNARDIIFS